MNLKRLLFLQLYLHITIVSMTEVTIEQKRHFFYYIMIKKGPAASIYDNNF